MRNMAAIAGLVAFAGTALCCCPEMGLLLVNGRYEGVTGLGVEESGLVVDLTLSMDLHNSLDGLSEGKNVVGTVELGFEGGEVLGLLGALGLFDVSKLLPGPVEVQGAIAPDGYLLLSTLDLLETCDSGACLRLAFVGQGEDTDGDSTMDVCAGTWTGVFWQEDIPIPLYGDFEVSGL